VKEGLGLKRGREWRQIMLSGLAGLAGSRQNGYISHNLWFSYDRVLRVGPSGPALFYYLNEPGLLPEPARGPRRPIRLGQPT
jgi:hypothetical protein